MDSLTSATKLRRDVIDIQSQLEAKRTEYREIMERIRHRQTALKKQKEQLQERLVKYYKLIQENDIKRGRAEKKCLHEIASQKEKNERIAELEDEFVKMEFSKKDLQVQIDKFSKYHRYLEDVLTYNEEYQHPSDIINRSKMLDYNNRELRQKKADLELAAEEQKLALQRKRKQEEDDILEQTNLLSKLQDQLERSQKRTVTTSDNMDTSIEMRAAAMREYGQVKLAAQNLFDVSVQMQRTARRGRAMGQLESQGLFAQLQFVGDCLSDFSYVAETLSVSKGVSASGGVYAAAIPTATVVTSVAAGASADNIASAAPVSRGPKAQSDVVSVG